MKFTIRILFLVVILIGLAACQGAQENLNVAATATPSNREQSTATQALPDAPEPSATFTLSPSPTPTITPQAPFAGVEVNRIGSESHVAALLEGDRVAWIRHNGLLWSRVEPVQGQRDWGVLIDLEFTMQQIHQAGSKLILIVRDTPDWAQKVPGYSCGPIAEAQFEAFGDFMFEAVQRYSQEPYGVKYWELGNEPDVETASIPNPKSIYGCWGDANLPFFGGGYYAEMLKVVYPRIKAADPEAQVLIGGLLLDCDPTNPPETQAGSGQFKDCSSSTFLEGVLQNQGGDFLDGISFHAYDYYGGVLGKYGNINWGLNYRKGGPALIAKVQYLTTLLGNYGYQDLPLFNTEVAVLCGSTGKEDVCLTGDFETTKAYYIAQAYAAARSVGLSANIWYSELGWRGSGIIDRSGVTGQAWQAFKTSSALLSGSIPTGAIDREGVTGYVFQVENQEIWLVWSQDGETHPLDLENTPEKILDVFGAEMESSQSLLISFAPVYIIFSK